MRNVCFASIAQVSAVLIASVGLTATASAQSRGVRVYTDVEFNGNSETFTREIPDLRSVGLNDSISSIELPRGEVWQVCTDSNYQGRCRNISGTVDDLRNLSLNDQISSMRRVNGSGFGGFGNNQRSGRNSAVIAYTNANYSGRSVEITGDTPDLRDRGLNDQISSIEIPTGQAWEICVNADYGNRCTVLTSDVSDLRQIGLNDQISSIRPANSYSTRDNRSRDNAQGTLVFYNRPNFRGTSRVLTPGSNTNVMARQGSVRINGRGVWRLCDNYGDCATVDRDVPNIADLGLADRITSVRPMSTSEYRRVR